MRRACSLLFFVMSCSGPASAVCGDQVVDAGELCDDGNSINEDECRNNCALPACGDGIVDAGEICFAAPSSIIASPSTALVRGDFNNDEHQDLVLAEQTKDQVLVFAGDGQGGFGAPAAFAVGELPSALVVRDFDADGNQDLAVGNPSSNSISVLLGDGQGSFSRADIEGVGDSNLLASDLNNDGDLDLISTNINEVTLLLGDGQGSFGAPTVFAVQDAPQAFVIDDFNNDGDQDLAATIGSDTFDPSRIDVFFGDGQGALGAPVPSQVDLLPGSIVAGDFDLDGSQDLVVAAFDFALLSLGDGQGSFAPGIEFSCGGVLPRAMTTADINRDGLLDVLISNATIEETSPVVALLGDGAGSLSAPVVLAELGFPGEVVVGDFNEDALSDLAVTSFDGQNNLITVFLSTP